MEQDGDHTERPSHERNPVMKEELKEDLDLTNLPLEDLIDSPKHNK